MEKPAAFKVRGTCDSKFAVLRPASPPSRILMVDDDSMIRNLSASVLTRFGYRVDTAEDGAVAWSILQIHSYSLLITDNNMPKMSGVELLKSVRSARMALPVIMATGVAPTHEFARNPGLQPDAILLKPYTVEGLLEQVLIVLETVAGPRRPGDDPKSPSAAAGNGLPLADPGQRHPKRRSGY
jgi:DNA-binding response OmpR family regulator